MIFIRVREWENYQHYRDRDPPWIKLHRKLLSSHTWVTSDDASRALAIAIMLLASGTDNRIPYDPAYLRRVAYLNSDPNLVPLIQTQFIDLIDETGKALADASGALANDTKCSSEERRDREEAEERERRARASAVPRETQNGETRTAEAVYGSMLEDWRRDVPEVNAEAFGRWIVHCELRGKTLGVPQRLAQARHLAGQGDFGAQAEIVDWCVMQGYKSLMPLGDVRARRDGMTHAGAKAKRWHPDDGDPTAVRS